MIRAGHYVDSGSRSNGWAAWIGLLESAPEISPVWLDGDFVREGRRGLPMQGLPALICAWRGDGLIFAAAGHPEYFPRSREIIAGGFRFLTGIAPAFGKQPRTPGSKTVGFYTPSVCGISDAERYAALWRDPAIDVIPIMDDDIGNGALDHLDEFIKPAASPA